MPRWAPCPFQGARDEARARGEKTYKGRLCGQPGHDGTRYVTRNRCKQCALEQSKRAYNEDLSRATHEKWRTKNRNRVMCTAARHRAKKLGREFTITHEDIVVPDVCPVLGIPLATNYGSNMSAPNSPTLDRIDNTKGYVPGNVAVISHRANALKRDAELHELEAIVAYMKRHQALATPSL